MKIVLLTSSRADYGIYKPLIERINNDSFFELKLIVFGTHLSAVHGFTIQEIEEDGYCITEKVESIIIGDSPESISSSMGLTQLKFANIWSRLKNDTDLIVCLGDRFEMMAAVLASLPFQIPIAHLHGGETTQGAIDEALRHALSKMAHLHFVSTNKYRQRIIQLGENPSRVFNVGALGVEAIHKLKLLSKKEFEESINFSLNKNNILVTFHPVTLENNTSEEQINTLLSVLDELKDTNIIITKSNADTYSQVINQTIDNFVKKNKHKAITFFSLGQTRYFSALQYMDVVVGNSSSGIIEVPSFNIPTINIGDRQKGRERADFVIDCLPTYDSIKSAFDKVYVKDWKKNPVNNPYDKKDTSIQIINFLKEIDVKNIMKKSFYDL